MAIDDAFAAVSEEERLRILAAACAGLSDIEVLQYALDQAVADLHALSGMVHWRGPAGSQALRLVVAAGLPPTDLSAQEDMRSAISRALDDGVLTFLPVTLDTGRARTVMLTAVPLSGTSDTALGVLSVLTDGPAEPPSERRAFLQALASWVTERCRTPELVAGPSRLWQPGHLEKAMLAVKVGSWEWDIRTGEVYWDEPALKVMGIDPATAPHTLDSWANIVHPEDLPRVMAAVQDAVRAKSLYEIGYRACRPDGTFGWMHARGRLILDDDGEPIRMVGTIWDTTEGRVARESAARALQYMRDAFVMVDSQWRVIFANLDGERLLGGNDLHGDELWDLVAGDVPDLRGRCLRAAADRTPAGFDLQWPTDQRWYHVRLVPVPDGLTFYFADITENHLRDAERAAAERATAERAAWTQELTRTFGEAVSARDVMRVITERVLPPFAATGLLIVTVEHDRLHIVGAVGHPPGLLRRIEQHVLADRSVLTDVLQTGVPAFIESRDQCLDTDLLEADAGMNAWALLPLVVPGHPGGCCVISFERPHPFTGEERTLLTALSGLIAQALARARMYDAEHARAEQLQRLLVPHDLPSLPGVTAAVRYLAAGAPEIGGAWYDVIPLSAERVALVIGDVKGHGVPQTATIGRLRTAARTLAGLELPPDDLLVHLNDLAKELADHINVTCLYAVYDPTSGDCALVNAGHPPPAVVHPDGTVQVLDSSPDLRLGTAEPPFSTVELCLPDGALFVLYTDDLIESGTRGMDDGMARLTGLLTGAPPRSRSDLDRLCDDVTHGMRPVRQPASDGAALLIARTQRLAAEDVASWSLPEDPIAAGQARDHVREQLAAWYLDDLVPTTELIASELVANVIRHAKGPIRLRLLRSRTLVCEVSDGSQTTPRIRRAAEMDEGGRGLQLVAAVSQRWGTRFTADGKCIWAEQPLPGSPAAA
ncbi:SpoIIE family protein phosphatase [Nonomuraea polychroma]|uniref:SpoIIE family protein phosphatase n=1 Tax=Nonomuraea polychroma TaxID=46176 RepID=UPI003D916F41